MNHELKKALQDAFEAPKPQKKRFFFHGEQGIYRRYGKNMECGAGHSCILSQGDRHMYGEGVGCGGGYSRIMNQSDKRIYGGSVECDAEHYRIIGRGKRIYGGSMGCGMGSPAVSCLRLLLIQAAYIRKWVWALSFMVFAAVLAASRFGEEDFLWIFSAMTPFLAVSSLSENIRSEVHGMAELEMSSRFTLKSIVLARMGILGAVHFGTLWLMVLLCRQEGAALFQTGVYLLTPYLLTSTIGLWIVRRINGREALYAVMGTALIIGVFPAMLSYEVPLLYEAEMFGGWAAVLGILLLAAWSEWKKNIERKAEIIWN